MIYSCKVLLLSFLVILFSVIVYFMLSTFTCFKSNDGKSMRYNVIAGVLSSRENFKQRLAARKTWIKEMGIFSSKAYFVIGKKDCSFPPEDRLDPYSCKEWTYNISGIQESYVYPLFLSKGIICSQPETIFQGVSFKIRHPVIVEHLGILDAALVTNKSLKVAIFEGATKKMVVQTEFTDVNNGHSQHGYLYRRVEAYLLPLGFEGILTVEGVCQTVTCAVAKSHDTGVILLSEIYENNEDSESVAFVNSATVAPSMLFKIHDVPDLQIHFQNKEKRRREWMRNLAQVEQKVQKESQQFRDMLFVDIIDVYRHLSSKLLEFFKWIAENEDFRYVLKTDDDCLMNIPLIMNKLDHIGHNIWWSKFRKNWPVNYFGKWADRDYSALVYPVFACGAGNVLSRNLVLWLAENKPYLHPYQGEDVSLGIWLAAVKPTYVDDELWTCNNNCRKNSYNLAELQLEEMFTAWEKYTECKSLCNCST